MFRISRVYACYNVIESGRYVYPRFVFDRKTPEQINAERNLEAERNRETDGPVRGVVIGQGETDGHVQA